MGCGVAVIHFSLFNSHFYFLLVKRSHPSLILGDMPSCWAWFMIILNQLCQFCSSLPVICLELSWRSRSAQRKVKREGELGWGEGPIRESREPFPLVPPFLICWLFYENLKLWGSWDAKPKSWEWEKGWMGEESPPWHNWAAFYTCLETTNS